MDGVGVFGPDSNQTRVLFIPLPFQHVSIVFFLSFFLPSSTSGRVDNDIIKEKEKKIWALFRVDSVDDCN